MSKVSLIKLSGPLNSREKIQRALLAWVNTTYPDSNANREAALRDLNTVRPTRYDALRAKLLESTNGTPGAVTSRIIATAVHHLGKLDANIRDFGVGPKPKPTPKDAGVGMGPRRPLRAGHASQVVDCDV